MLVLMSEKADFAVLKWRGLKSFAPLIEAWQQIRESGGSSAGRQAVASHPRRTIRERHLNVLVCLASCQDTRYSSLWWTTKRPRQKERVAHSFIHSVHSRSVHPSVQWQRIDRGGLQGHSIRQLVHMLSHIPASDWEYTSTFTLLNLWLVPLTFVVLKELLRWTVGSLCFNT